MSDRLNLERFVSAHASSYDTALAEIRRGSKRGHWMWFIFPQFVGLGKSATAERFAIRSLEEARAYLAHPILGPRLRECVEALEDLTGTTSEIIFGSIDAMKLRSSLTLFAEASDSALFAAALKRWFEGERDPATLRLVERD